MTRISWTVSTVTHVTWDDRDGCHKRHNLVTTISIGKCSNSDKQSFKDQYVGLYDHYFTSKPLENWKCFWLLFREPLPVYKHLMSKIFSRPFLLHTDNDQSFWSLIHKLLTKAIFPIVLMDSIYEITVARSQVQGHMSS